jgi:hypothetical protein
MKILFFILSVIFIQACTTAPTIQQQGAPADAAKSSGFWEAKANIKDLKTQKSYQVSLDITGIAPDRLRIDVTGTLGVAIASIVVNKDEVFYSIYRQKKFFSGLASENALRPVFSIDLNPKTLINITFDKEIVGADWSCITDGAGVAESCARLGGEKIQWKERNGELKRVVVESSLFELQIVYKSYSKLSTKVLNNPEIFHLEPPKDFAKYKTP